MLAIMIPCGPNPGYGIVAFEEKESPSLLDCGFNGEKTHLVGNFNGIACIALLN